ncbi:MAG: hypothetical protein ACQUHE_00615 [Bacteroidia bacterium]
MIVTVVPIFDFEVQPSQPLKKVMTLRLKRLAEELQDTHLKDLEFVEPFLADVVIYLSYNSKYTIRWRIANDVPKDIELVVADICARLNYIYWKTATLNVFKGGDNL